MILITYRFNTVICSQFFCSAPYCTKKTPTLLERKSILYESYLENTLIAMKRANIRMVDFTSYGEMSI